MKFLCWIGLHNRITVDTFRIYMSRGVTKFGSRIECKRCKKHLTEATYD